MENNLANTIPISWFENSCGIAQNTSFEYPICKQQKTEFISISLCTEGFTKVLCNRKEIIHSKNSFLVIMDNEMIEYNKEHSPDFNHYLLLLSPDFFKIQIIKDYVTHFLYFKYHPFLETTEEETRYLTDLFKMIMKTIEQENNDGKGKRLSILFNLLFETVFQTKGYQKGINSNIEPRIEELFKQFNILLETYYKQSREVSFYADKLCISTNYLFKITKTILNVSPKTFINEVIILQAKHLLDTKKEKNVQEIAIELGFQSQSFFGKFFKQQTGMSPSDYRLYSNPDNAFTPPRK
ncbi:MAG: AraC family transcriptional regulator [Bacteroidaceae bacterium]|nr:AraC family transcriptional regulator [Bacteroidaceae bacterium]